ncbi:MAG: DUF2442 domain-containing protein [Bacteroidetes bacterium]|nr:DUF2442 domain-containing protein [Bacteroidota bacterium]
MNLSKNGINTSISSVTSIEELGFWVLIEDQEYFIPFDDYPAFLNATIDEIFDVTMVGPSQLSWGKLDIDIELDALMEPHRFPLVYQ